MFRLDRLTYVNLADASNTPTEVYYFIRQNNERACIRKRLLVVLPAFEGSEKPLSAENGGQRLYKTTRIQELHIGSIKGYRYFGIYYVLRRELRLYRLKAPDKHNQRRL